MSINLRGENSNWPVFLSALFALFVIVYFPMMAVMPLTIDAELNAVADDYSGWIVQGRWATYLLLQYVLPPSIVPYFPLALFGLCTASSYLMVVTSRQMPLDRAALLGFLAFGAFPSWLTLLEFPANTVPASVAMLCLGASVGAAAINRISLRLLITVFLLTFSIGIYQAFLFSFIGIALGTTLIRKTSSKDKILSAGEIILVSLISVAAHFLVQSLFLRFYGFRLAYIDTFLRPDYFFGDPVGVIAATLKYIGAVYLGSAKIYGAVIWAIPAILVLGIFSVARRGNWVDGFIAIGVLLSPFPLAFLAGGTVPLRMMVAVPVAVWVFCFLALHDRLAWVRISSTVLIVLLGVQTSAVVAQHSAMRAMIDRFNLATSVAINQRISNVMDDQQSAIVDFYGALPAPAIYASAFHSTAGGSYFSWDGGNPYRMLAYMKLIGFSDLQLAPKETREANKSLFSEMPVWPALGSVRRDGNVILIKLGQTPGYYVN